ncbi:hypothetical protein KKB40_01660 [Patescibacteria group bacterium]|nr:hypothetical protein [Patescibacteria group bacterium]
MKLLDTSSLICLFTEVQFSQGILLWLDHGYKIFLPTEAYEELSEKYPTKKKVEEELKKKLIQKLARLDQKEMDEIKKRHISLGRGELAVIIHGISQKEKGEKYWVVLDDKKARQVASKYKLNLTGSYGLVKALYNRKAIDQNKFTEIVKRMKTNCRISIEGI